MVNDDLLQQFKKLLEENNKQQDENLEKRLDAQDQKFQQRLDAAIDPLHERFDAQQEHINTVKTELSEKIDQQAHDVADILAKAVMPDIDRHETQIKELQEAVGLRPKH
jgi:hypothetical protein